MGVTPLGAHALQQGMNEKYQLFTDLVSGAADIAHYTPGLCYDAVAFCLALQGRISYDIMTGRGGQNLLPVFSFDNGALWGGENIAQGCAVGFKRIGNYDPGYYHAALAVGGGTVIRGVNSVTMTPGWPYHFDLQNLQENDQGVYFHDDQPIEVRYV
ncbi:MAG TPA: hypothetical protein VHW44_30030 [Pseudonocardiaceae bacterium]|nr:hypothetical protein [Pseudonocardiaceae bacterium]